MSLVIDCTESPEFSFLRAAGVTGVVRYLCPDYLPKKLGEREYEKLRAGGFDVGLVYEYDARDWLNGNGKLDAATAVNEAQKLGIGSGVIYTACDFDIAWNDFLRTGNTYATNFLVTLKDHGYETGVYGPVDVLTWCHELLGYKHFWQSMSGAHSSGRNAHRYEHTQLWQRTDRAFGNVRADVNEVYGPWNTVLGSTDMSKADAELAAAIVAVGSPTTRGYTEDLGDTTEEKAISKADGQYYNKYNLKALSAQMDAIGADLNGVINRLTSLEALVKQAQGNVNLAPLIALLVRVGKVLDGTS